MWFSRLNYIILISAGLLFSACWGKDGGDKKSKGEQPETTPEVTKLTYKINLNNQDAQGFYLGKADTPIIITASANGPNKDKATWIAIPQPLNGGLGTKGASSIGGSNTITEQQSFTFSLDDPADATEYQVTCSPAQQKTINGVKLYEGRQVFKIKLTP